MGIGPMAFGLALWRSNHWATETPHLRAWSHSGRFFDYDRSRSQKLAARSHYIFCFSSKRTRCSCSLYLKVLCVPFCLTFFSLITLSFAFAVPRFLCLSPSPARHHCLHQVRYCCLSLAQARCFSLAVSHSLSLAVSHSLSLALFLTRSRSLFLTCSRSLFLTRSHSLFLTRSRSLFVTRSRYSALSLSLSLSHTHIHSRHTLWVQARCELTADHRVNDNWVFV